MRHAFILLLACAILSLVTMSSCNSRLYPGVDLIMIHDYDVVDTIDVDEVVIYNYADSSLYAVYATDGRIYNVIARLKHLKKK